MAPNSFEKHHRLLKACDFSYLKVNSQTLSRPWLRVFYSSSRLGSEKTRVGFSVSKKVGKANCRNRVKRILREKFRLSPYKVLGKDILFVVSPNLFKKIENQDQAEAALCKSFDELFHLLGSDNDVSQ